MQGWLIGGAFAIGALSIAGLPPSIGFFGKATVFQASIVHESIALIVLLVVGSALSFFYIFRIYQCDFWTAAAERTTSPVVLQIVVYLLVGVVVLLGLWPEPLLALSQQAALILVEEP